MAPTFRHGKNTCIKITTGGTTKLLSSGFAEASLEREVDSAEVSVYGDSIKRYLVGLQDATFSMSGNFSSTHEKLLTGLLGISTGITLMYGPEGSSAGRRKYSFPAVITSFKVDSPAGDKVGMEVEWQVAGSITSTVWT